MKKFPIEKYKYYFYTEKDAEGNDVNCVVAVSTYAGKVVRGIAKCHPHDIYDEQAGKELAAYRCGLKIAKKRMARATRRLNEVVAMDEDFRKFKLDTAEYYRNAAEELRMYMEDERFQH